MNKFIKEQLLKIKIPMSDWDDNTLKIIIYKQDNTSKADFVVGNIYNITVANYVINPPPNFSLASNWNYGTVPPEENMTAQVLQIMGNMLKFSCKGESTGITWEGWLPRKSITTR